MLSTALRRLLGVTALVPVLVAASVVTSPGAVARPVEAGVQQIAVDDLPATSPAPGGEVVTGVHETAPFRLVGLSWPAADEAGAEGDDPALAVRTRSGGTWGAWEQLSAMDAEPSGREGAVQDLRTGTEPLVTELSDAVQVRVEPGSGPVPPDLRLELIDPGTSRADGAAPARPAASASAAAGRPAVVSRAQWGADESYRSGSPTYDSTVRAAVIHHTAGSNSYSTPAEAYAEVRGVYAYHTRSLGWADIGYNALVDKFGTIYEGRAGGLDRAVRGAHTGGFNTATFGVSVLGDYETAQVSDAIVTSVAEITAWKLGLHGVDPNGTTQLTSAGGGTSRYAAGTTVTVPTVLGHRDLGRTACPGQHLYAELGRIRSLVASYGGGAGAEPAAPLAGVVRLAGEDRYSTSVAQARAVHPEQRTVVVVSGEDGASADGLVAAPLAVQREAPILLSRGDRLPDPVVQEVQRRSATTAYIVGGTSVLQPAVERQLRDLGVADVVRIAGADRYATAAQVALEVGRGGSGDGVAVLASGESGAMVDALAVGGPAGATDRPVLLTRSDGAPEATLAALQALAPRTVVVVGGTAVVSDRAAAGVLARLGLPTGSLVRIAGADRYATAAAVATAWAGSVGTGTVVVASGESGNVVDAISAGAHGRLVLLTPSASTSRATTDWLRGRDVGAALVVGGPSAVSDAVVTELGAAVAGR